MVLKRRLLFCLILILALGAAVRSEGGAARAIDGLSGAVSARFSGSGAARAIDGLSDAVSTRFFGSGAARAIDGVQVSDFVRLHVVAEDDGDAAQALKLEVRDACLMCARTLLADCVDADEAWTVVCDNVDLIRLVAALRARSRGWRGTVTAEAGVFAFPERRYGGVVVPAGEYRALRVVIGTGEGRNWWCVLYPSLCLAEDCADGPVRFHSTLLDWLCALLGGAA